jgi:hypothetical protein
MKKQTTSFIIGIGVVSVLAGIYAGIRAETFTEAVSGVFIGVALIGTALIERSKTEEGDKK